MFARTHRVAAIILVLLLMAAATVEAIFGAWFSADPLDQINLPRDLRVTVDASPLYAGGGELLCARDHWGLRGTATDPAKVSILTIGGGGTDQPYLPEQLTWQKVLEQSFRAEGREVVVGNFGFDGQSTVGHLAALERWLPHVPGLKPRFVLAYVGLDDSHGAESPVDALADPSPLEQIVRKSAILRLGGQLAAMVEARHAEFTRQTVARPDKNGADQSDTEGYRQRLAAMAREIHAMGAVPIFVTQPRGDYRLVEGKAQGVADAEGPNGIDRHRSLAAFNQATRDVCSDAGLLCLDLARELTFDSDDFYDYLHNTPAGAAKIGRWLHGKLAGLV